ncbi:uncharacterized protein N7483_002199 [Penicillium malachiteum]|uniref:uncharacterized protein n=1 Tax=Penicillium malachiteum TaxID=1324776 RepID=UPI0025471B04|nr:uncharacterized protein N7483_002199 [Penicillium malachiteum]KAJ5737074.1 hypothetical protein N7483_002199 [Penicillium malachiteum]
MIFKTTSIIAAFAAIAVANPTVGYAGYFYAGCNTTTVDLTNAYAGTASCVNIEDFPIKSFSAYIESGECADGTTAVLSTYTASGCDDTTLYQTVDVTSAEQCFEIDTTFVSVKAECV